MGGSSLFVTHMHTHTLRLVLTDASGFVKSYITEVIEPANTSAVSALRKRGRGGVQRKIYKDEEENYAG